MHDYAKHQPNNYAFSRPKRGPTKSEIVMAWINVVIFVVLVWLFAIYYSAKPVMK